MSELVCTIHLFYAHTAAVSEFAGLMFTAMMWQARVTKIARENARRKRKRISRFGMHGAEGHHVAWKTLRRKE